MQPKLVVITGPTASGKTALGVALAQRLGGEVVSADSMQIYRGMDIGTAKPTAAEMAGIPHHMIDVADPWEDFSVARYVEMAAACVDDILARGKLPIVAGGTGLYVDSLLSGRTFAAFSPDSSLRKELEAELADNQQKEEAQYDLFCRQVRDEEERGTASFWSVIFKATSFSDLLGRIDFINEVAEHDQSVINDLRQLRQQMQADRQALEEQRSQLESRQAELNSQLEAATQLIAKYNETADGLNDLAAQEKAAADELDAQIQARREEENRNNGGDNSGGGGGGGGSGSDETPSSDGYIWPSDCRLITSGYGGRDQPTPGASTTHMGVDIGASYGSYIYAVKSGTVVGSKYSWGGYGNYVEIDHGNGNFTLYAHMSERLVEVGEHVEQGEVIGLCGSTGISTGPHVHYEIWENYTRINPLNRLPGYIPYWW